MALEVDPPSASAPQPNFASLTHNFHGVAEPLSLLATSPIFHGLEGLIRRLEEQRKQNPRNCMKKLLLLDRNNVKKLLPLDKNSRRNLLLLSSDIKKKILPLSTDKTKNCLPLKRQILSDMEHDSAMRFLSFQSRTYSP